MVLRKLWRRSAEHSGKVDERFAFDKPELQKKAIGGAWVTYAGKHCTEYGVASTAARVVRSIVNDEKLIMPVSMLLEGEYGEKMFSLVYLA